IMRVAIIGTGAIAPLHIRAITNCKQQIVALCDVDCKKAENLNGQFGLNAKIYTDYKEMLNAEEIDAVHICTPHYLHAEMICEALKRNIHTLCEKPLAISFEQLDRIEEAVKNSSATLGVNLQNRYNKSVLYVKEFFEGKKIKSAEAHLVWERNADYYAQGEWRGKWATEGGGVMINQALHHLDVLQFICGMPVKVTASVGNYSLRNVVEVEDTAFGLFTLPDGGNFIVHATNAAKHCFPIGVMFNGGKDTAEISADNIIVNGKFLTKSNGLPVFGKEEWGTGHQNLITDFYDCLQSGKKFGVDFYEGSKVVRLVLSMYRSHGNEIRIQDR
ncbi:MAG: Gfo/Idh/MocA family oxidoreductase, partial [Clostridia bacterium]|nr:Gfo/Idh/MocA family oxidoreductase [Clostridia bacterium]